MKKYLCQIFAIFFVLYSTNISAQIKYSTTGDDATIIQVIAQGSINDINKLISSGYDVNGEYDCTPMLNSAIFSIAQEIDSPPRTAVEKVRFLLEKKANPNIQGCGTTPLAAAITIPAQIEAIKQKMLTDFRTDNNINKRSDYVLLEQELKDFFTIKQQAAGQAVIEIIDSLISAGADINMPYENASTPLHLVANYTDTFSLTILRHLISNGANVNVKNILGNTPLFIAYRVGNEEAIKMLLEAGADPLIRNNKGILYNQLIQ